MKYNVGNKVRYDSGDWQFYGTVSAVFENSISPCYRLSVERMVKKACKFSITQFEFELDPYTDEAVSANEERYQLIQSEMEAEPIPVMIKKSESIQESVTEKKQRKKQEPDKVELIHIQTTEPAKRKTSEVWERNLELYLKGKKSYAIYNWITNNRKHFQAGTLSDEKCEKLKKINFPFKVIRKNVEKTQKTEQHRRKRGDEWEINFESYQKGERNDIISSWIAENRKEFKTGKLTEAKYKKLLGINFSFDIGQMKDDNWEKQLEEWKKGDRRSKPVQQWKQRSLKQYSEDKLSVDRIIKLREAGILK